MTLLLFIFIFLPLLAVLINVIFPGLFFGQVKSSSLGLIGDIFHRPLWKQSLLNSVTLALGTATLGTMIGGILATIRARWDFVAARWLDMTAWVLLIAPSFMIAQGWVLFASADGLVHQWLGLTWVTSFIFSPTGSYLLCRLVNFRLLIWRLWPHRSGIFGSLGMRQD
ncbi:hypothetical protein JCM10914_3308 [Paenibacillus sp. JCM 10914]|nr:hypothetical protein JCM10914_3308 [Paenibacillus sp. JCM 10914]